MARIRATKFELTSKKNQPKIAFFHDKNFQDFLDDFPIKKTKGTKPEVITLDKKQSKKMTDIISSKKNNKVFKFHRS